MEIHFFFLMDNQLSFIICYAINAKNELTKIVSKVNTLKGYYAIKASNNDMPT